MNLVLAVGVLLFLFMRWVFGKPGITRRDDFIDYNGDGRLGSSEYYFGDGNDL